MTTPHDAGAMARLLEEVRQCFTRDDDLPNNLLQRIDAALAKPVKQEPAGWKLVPEKATPEQIMAAAKAAKQYMDECGGNSPSVIYEAMLSASPSPQPQAQPTAAQAVPQGWQFDLDEEAAEVLRDTIGKDEPSRVTMSLCDGHSGPGLYVWVTDYPEEGSLLLLVSPTTQAAGEQSEGDGA